MMKHIFSRVPRISATPKMELIVSLVNGFQLLTNSLKNSTLDVKGS